MCPVLKQNLLSNQAVEMGSRKVNPLKGFAAPSHHNHSDVAKPLSLLGAFDRS